MTVALLILYDFRFEIFEKIGMDLTGGLINEYVLK